MRKPYLYVVGPKSNFKLSMVDILHNSYPGRSKHSEFAFNSSPLNIELNAEMDFNTVELLNLETAHKRIENEPEVDSYVLYLLSAENWQNFMSDVNSMQRLYPKTKIIIAISPDLMRRKKLAHVTVKKRLPHLEYIIPLSSHRKLEGVFHDLFFVLRRLIINKNSKELNDARRLINDNFKSKNPVLDLGNCGLTSLREIPELFLNTHLETLILSNEWGIYENGKWVRKTSSNKSDPNILFGLPKEMAQLENLKILICGGNWKTNKRRSYYGLANWYINDISPLAKLTSLQVLNLSNNLISATFPLNGLRNLQRLYLNNNIIERALNISNFMMLQELYLSNNKIRNVEFAAKSKSLGTIDLHSNLIKDLSPLKKLISKLDIKDSRWEYHTISIAGNPLSVPPMEVASKGKRNILAYFSQLEAESRINIKPYDNTDIKLIMVGNSNAGKSTYVNWLETGVLDKNIPTTHWLNFIQFTLTKNGKDYNLRVFDFGGQEYYHDTHHLFFTNRTAYLLIWDRQTNHFEELTIDQIQNNGKSQRVNIETFPLEYWLDSIRYHTEKRNLTQTEQSIEKLLDERDEQILHSAQQKADWVEPTVSLNEKNGETSLEEENILIVQNKVDSMKSKIFIDEAQLKKAYPKIYDLTRISLHHNRGLEQSKELLFEILDSLEVANSQYLGTWNFIKQDIEKKVFLRFLSLQEFLDYCNDVIKKAPELKGMSRSKVNSVLFTKEDAITFASFLADIGICLFYPENPSLKDKVFLNQSQVLSNIYKVLTNINRATGEVNSIEIAESLGINENDYEVANITDLMLHFKILFEHPHPLKKNYIAPLYLPKEPPMGIKLFNPLFEKPAYRFQYRTFIHKSIILDFFHHYGAKALSGKKKDDLYYIWKNGIVLKDEESKEIVMVKFLPADIESNFSYLDIYIMNKNTTGTFLDKIIEDIERLNLGLKVEKLIPSEGTNEFIPLEVVLQNEASNNTVFHYENRYYKLTSFKKYLKNPTKMKKVFISYSKQDIRHVNKFIEHLSGLQRDGKVSHWYCSELEPGSDWNEKIKMQMEESDIICFMISPNFMRTDYIFEHEVKRAIEKKKENADFKIVPIILDFCKWSTVNDDLSKYTALPYAAKPVLDFDNQNMAWYIVEECLRFIIDNNLQPEDVDFYSKQKLPPDILKIYTRIVEGKVDKNT